MPGGFKEDFETYEECVEREFKEETNLDIVNELTFLGTKKVNNNKLVTIFYTTQDLDETKAQSNYFELEWPPKSGIINKYPEMDKSKWIELEEAKELIFENQLYFLEKLEEIL